MKMEPITSEGVSAIGYDGSKRTLAVQWKNGSIYHYQDVPHHVYHKLKKAASASLFLREHIRYQYNWEKPNHANA